MRVVALVAAVGLAACSHGHPLPVQESRAYVHLAVTGGQQITIERDDGGCAVTRTGPESVLVGKTTAAYWLSAHFDRTLGGVVMLGVGETRYLGRDSDVEYQLDVETGHIRLKADLREDFSGAAGHVHVEGTIDCDPATSG